MNDRNTADDHRLGEVLGCRDGDFEGSDGEMTSDLYSVMSVPKTLGLGASCVAPGRDAILETGEFPLWSFQHQRPTDWSLLLDGSQPGK
jgi:hypothetical protein